MQKSAKAKYLIATLALIAQIPAVAGKMDFSVADVKIGMQIQEVHQILKKTNPDLLLEIQQKDNISHVNSQKINIQEVIFSNKPKKNKTHFEEISVSLSAKTQQVTSVKYEISGKNFNLRDFLEAINKKYNISTTDAPIPTNMYIIEGLSFVYKTEESPPQKLSRYALCSDEKSFLDASCQRFSVQVIYTGQINPMFDPTSISGYKIKISDNQEIHESKKYLENVNNEIWEKMKAPKKSDKVSL